MCVCVSVYVFKCKQVLERKEGRKESSAGECSHTHTHTHTNTHTYTQNSNRASCLLNCVANAAL